MKRLLTQEQKEKKERTNKTIVSSVLVILMFLSVLGYAFTSNVGDDDETEQVEVYNGIEFINKGQGIWEFVLSNEAFYTRFLPNDTLNISVTTNRTLQDYYQKPLFFVAENQGIAREIAINLQNFVLRTQMACLEENCSADLPIKNCSNDNIIIFEDSDFIEIIQKDNCIFVKSPEGEGDRASDALFYKLIGMI